VKQFVNCRTLSAFSDSQIILFPRVVAAGSNPGLEISQRLRRICERVLVAARLRCALWFTTLSLKLPKKLVPATSINGAQRIDGAAQKEFHAHCTCN
jgi:hypothetical protein